jgi:hypothetical protein
MAAATSTPPVSASAASSEGAGARPDAKSRFNSKTSHEIAICLYPATRDYLSCCRISRSADAEKQRFSTIALNPRQQPFPTAVGIVRIFGSVKLR